MGLALAKANQLMHQLFDAVQHCENVQETHEMTNWFIKGPVIISSVSSHFRGEGRQGFALVYTSTQPWLKVKGSL